MFSLSRYSTVEEAQLRLVFVNHPDARLRGPQLARGLI